MLQIQKYKKKVSYWYLSTIVIWFTGKNIYMTLRTVYLHIYPTKIFSLEIKMNITVIISSINADNKVTFSCRTHTFVCLPELFSSLQTRLLKLIIYFFPKHPKFKTQLPSTATHPAIPF